MEILVRIILNLIFIQLEIVQPFNRKIHPDDIWQNHRNPITASYGKFFFICHYINPMDFLNSIFIHFQYPPQHYGQ
jgi:hypothetical protein